MRARPIGLTLVLSFAAIACATKPPPTLRNASTASAPPHVCVGTWHEQESDSRLTITGGSVRCGHMEYPACGGDVVDCTWAADGVHAHYRCTGSDETYTGTLSLTCTPASSTVVDQTDGHGIYTETFDRR